MADQSELTRYRRLREGRCPTHGILLVQGDVYNEEENLGELRCPRRDCSFRTMVLWDTEKPLEFYPVLLELEYDIQQLRVLIDEIVKE
jgi:hypothetical protein